MRIMASRDRSPREYIGSVAAARTGSPDTVLLPHLFHSQGHGNDYVTAEDIEGLRCGFGAGMF